MTSYRRPRARTLLATLGLVVAGFAPARVLAQTSDRYGPSQPAATPTPAPILHVAAPVAPAPRRLLAWSGKATFVAPRPAPAAVNASPPTPTPTPTPTPVPAPRVVAAVRPGGARYYSLHSAYGLTPDPAPIPPQFFGPTVDLTAAETTDPVRRASSTTAAASTTSAINAARLANEAQ